MKTHRFMKTIVCLALAGTVFPHVALAQKVVTTSNAFVQMPIFESYQVGARADESNDLAQACEKFKALIAAYDEMPGEARLKTFTTRRDEPGDWQGFTELKFRAGFSVGAKSLRNLLEGVDKSLLVAYVGSMTRSLPFATQVPMSVEVVDFTQSQLAVSVSDDSLSAKAKALGLSYGGVEIEHRADAYRVNVYTKDLACDLLEGKAKLILNTKALVRPEVKAQDELGQFYFDLSQRVVSILKKKKSIRSKMAAVGIAMGRMLDESGIHELESQSSIIENLIDFLFRDDTLSFSAAWTQSSDKEPFVNMQKTTTASVKIQLKVL